MPSYNTNLPCVYIVQEPGTDLYKIGRTKNFPLRLVGLNSSRTNPLHVVHLVHFSDVVAAEVLLHHDLDAYRIKGEWFKLATLDLWKQSLEKVEIKMASGTATAEVRAMRRAKVRARELKSSRAFRKRQKLLGLPTYPKRRAENSMPFTSKLSMLEPQVMPSCSVSIPRPPWRVGKLGRQHISPRFLRESHLNP